MGKISKNGLGIILAIAIVISSLSVGFTALAASEFNVAGNIIGNEHIEIAVGDYYQPTSTTTTATDDVVLTTLDQSSTSYEDYSSTSHHTTHYPSSTTTTTEFSSYAASPAAYTTARTTTTAVPTTATTIPTTIQEEFYGNALFTIGTTGGDPLLNSDDYKMLLFGHSSPWSSYSTIVIDDLIYMYGTSGSNFTQTPTFNAHDGSNVSVVEYGDISVKQILRIIKNPATGRKDLVEIKYEITNNGSRPHDIGTRIMLDTMLGDNDCAPFRVPGTGDVVTQTEYVGNNIPQYWQVFDSLTDPTVVAQGTFITSDVNKPDKVQFTNWGRVNGNPWEEPVTPGQENGDSAVTVTWNKKTMAPRETRTYSTYYGLSALEITETDCLSLSLFAPAEINVENNAYAPNPTTITAYVKNTSSQTVENAEVSLDIAYPFSFNSASEKTINLGTMAPGEERQISWLVDIALTDTTITVPVTAKATATNVDTVSATRSVLVPEIDNVYSIKYYVGTEIFKTYYYEPGEIISPVEAPSAEGYIFKGWINSETGDNTMPDVMPEKNLVFVADLEAKTYTATFMVNGTVYAEMETEYASAIDIPADPEAAEGMAFAGWTPEVPATMPANDCVFTATWVSTEKHIATYLVDGKTYRAYEVIAGDAIPVPEDPQKCGMKFKGWNPEVPDKMPGNDIVFEAEWEIDKTLVAVVVGGTVVGATAIGIASSNAAAITTVSVVGGVTAVWVLGKYVIPELAETHKVVYKVDGKVYRVYLVKTGETIDVPANPQKEGKTFAGWDPEIPEVMPDHDLEFNANWSSPVDVKIPKTGSVPAVAISAFTTTGLALAALVFLKKKKED